MATSKFTTSQYTSEHFVESCGAILFDLSEEPKKVCLIHCVPKDEWLLAKGRRNCGESRQGAALREVTEETGYACRLLPLKMPTRAPQPNDPPDAPDQVQVLEATNEAFMVTIRKVGETDIKVIWWYAASAESLTARRASEEADLEPTFFPLEEAIEKLTFLNDRDVLKTAISLVSGTSP